MSDYLTDDEQVAALRKWWDENGTQLVVTLVLVVGGVIGWRWWVDYHQVRTEAASALYQQFLEARGAEAVRNDESDLAAIVEQLDDEFAGTSYQTFTLLYRAHDAVEAEKYAEAADLLHRVIDGAPDDLLKDLARTRIARVLAQQGEYDAALTELSNVRGEGYRALAAETKGDILVARGDAADQAAEAYRSALAETPAGEAEAILEAKLADVTRADATP